MADQGVHEIQLNGKQLVFMFMSATVAAVVIFLCGVMVGRGVNAPRVAGAASAPAEDTIDPTAIPDSTPAAETVSSGEPISAQEALKNLTYADRLEAPEPPPEPTVEPVATPVPAVAESKASRPPVIAAATPSPAPAPARAASPTKADPKGDGFVVQVTSLRSKGEADAVVRRLNSKGYPAFVSTGGPRVFRVRVGKYTDRREADSIARRLEKEEQFKPWITR
jgi:DedD protein